MDHPSAPTCLNSRRTETVELPRALSRHGCRKCDAAPLGHGASPPLVPPRTGGCGSLSTPARQHAADRYEILARAASIPAERIHSSAPLASALGFRLHQRTRSGARNPNHANPAGGHVLWVCCRPVDRQSRSSSGETWMVRRLLLGNSFRPAVKLSKTTQVNIENSDNGTT